ncbi:MAG: four helix bundle protein [Chloroflexia bacterium]|nr:four helix bundle protein [Chloroflexia bacterium]
MTAYKEWLDAVPSEITGDPLWKQKVYRLALFIGELAWGDVSKLFRDHRTRSLADQLYRAVGSVAANISEGYSRRSGRDQARFHEYALGSAREARGWYYQGRHLLGESIAQHRIELLTQIIRLLLTIIPAERSRKISDEKKGYETDLDRLLHNIPLP